MILLTGEGRECYVGGESNHTTARKHCPLQVINNLWSRSSLVPKGRHNVVTSDDSLANVPGLS